MKPLILKLDEKRWRAVHGALLYVVDQLEPSDVGDLHEYYMLVSICEEIYHKVAARPKKIKLKYYQLVGLEKALINWPIGNYGSTVLLQDIQPHIHSRQRYPI